MFVVGGVVRKGVGVVALVDIKHGIYEDCEKGVVTD